MRFHHSTTLAENTIFTIYHLRVISLRGLGIKANANSAFKTQH